MIGTMLFISLSYAEENQKEDVPPVMMIHEIQWLMNEGENKILFLSGKMENKILFLAKSDGSDSNELARGNIVKTLISPNKEVLGFIVKGDGLWLLDFQNLNKSKVFTGEVLDMNWSDDSKYILCSVIEKDNQSVYVVNCNDWTNKKIHSEIFK